ncbi:MAG: hypothetical protein ACM3ST_09550 [Bdellovibrio bacteriovorus]
MLEYVFFEKEPRGRFQSFLDQQGIPWTLEAGDPESVVVVDDARLDATLAERLETLYDELFALEQSLFVSDKKAPPPKDKGLPLRLKDGTRLRADLPEELVKRLQSVLSAEELDAIADAIACALDDAEGEARG